MLSELLETRHSTGVGWIPILDPREPTEDSNESCMMSKHVKVMPHLYPLLRGFDYTCFLDSKVGIISEDFVEDMIRKHCMETPTPAALLLRYHWYGHNNIWVEYFYSVAQERYRRESDKMLAYMERRFQEGWKEDIPIHSACGLLLRNQRHLLMNAINETWYRHIQECGLNDQVSFFFVAQIFAGGGAIHSFQEYPYLDYTARSLALRKR